MKIVVFGLTISRPGATATRRSGAACAGRSPRRGHRVVFFERDVPYYAGTRDLFEVPGGELVLYDDWDDVRRRGRARGRRRRCRDGHLLSAPTASRRPSLVLDAPRAVRVFYDLDTPVTLSRLERGESHDLYRPARPARFRSGAELHRRRGARRLRAQLGARRVAPLYGHVDPGCAPADARRGPRSLPTCPISAPMRPTGRRRSRRCSSSRRGGVRERRFLIGGAQYPAGLPLDATTSSSCATCRRPTIRPSSPRRA